MSCVWTSEGLAWILLEFIFYCLQIACGQHDIRIKYDYIFAISALGTVVATLARSAVLFGVIMQIKDVCVLVANILAWFN